MNKQQKLQALQDQLKAIKQEIEHLKEPETYYVVVHSNVPDRNWYNIGDVFKVFSEITPNSHGGYHKLVGREYVGVGPEHITKILDPIAVAALELSAIKDKQI